MTIIKKQIIIALFLCNLILGNQNISLAQAQTENLESNYLDKISSSILCEISEDKQQYLLEKIPFIRANSKYYFRWYLLIIITIATFKKQSKNNWNPDDIL